MNIAICDDLREERAAIAEHLHSYFFEPKLSEYESGAELMSAHEKNRFDLILLDMLMPGLNGLSRFTKLVPDARFISVNYMGVSTDILLGNIVYLESELRKVIFHLAGGERIAVTAKLEEFFSLCDEPDFCRCHKSFLVNLSYVDAISGEGFCLSDGILLRISRTFLAEAKNVYFDYVFGKGGLHNDIGSRCLV